MNRAPTRIPRRVWSLVIATLAAPGHLAPAQSPQYDTDVASETLFARSADIARQFIVQIETVGGAQPLAAAPVRRTQIEGEDDKESDDRPDPNLFRDSPGASFLLADGPTTGIVYSADGLILTSSFNFVREPSIVTVKLPDGRQLPARIVARDHVRKITLLRVDADNLPTPIWTPREQIRPGQWAVALGRGFGGEAAALSVGIVSAVNRMMGNAIQTDARLSPVNYGGPLMDTAGRILGICVPMAQRPGELAGIELYDSGVGFAIPGWRVHQIVAQLQKGESLHRGWLGMQIDPKVENGVRILCSADPSPIRSAGARDGDFIVDVNQQPIKHFGHLVKALYMIPAGEKVNIRLLRGADYIDVDVVLARSSELGPLPPVEEPFDPSKPANQPEPEQQDQE